MTRRLVPLLLAAATAAGCGLHVTHPPAEVRMVDRDDPYAVATAALHALSRRDAASWSALGGAPDAFAEAEALSAVHEPSGLYFQEDESIAAVLRDASPGVPALWIRIVRAGDGFRVDRLMRTETDPSTDEPVEG